MKNWFQGSQIHERHNDIKSSLVLGNQWGDEGKGKVTDGLAQNSDAIIRFQGGHNAGHTVKVKDKMFDLHILPSGMISEGKINIITSGCVLGIELGKIDLSKIEVRENGVHCPYSLDDLLKRNQDKEVVKVGLIPELQKLEKGGIDIQKSGLKISGEVIVIGMHNVLLDGFDEVCRIASGLKAIGSTGSGISRAYSSEIQRYHFTLNDLLYREDDFYSSIKALWMGYQHIFPQITPDILRAAATKERASIIEYIGRRDIEVITNETEYIRELHRSGKKIIGEGAQSSMIGASNSFYGTASSPGLQSFMETTGLTAAKVGNVFLVHKLPPSSVGERPGYLKFGESPELESFRQKYDEFGVSTKRPRDIFRHSLPETARGAWLNLRGIDDESKIVPVYNRVDGIKDSLALSNDLLQVVTGFKYRAQETVNSSFEDIFVGINSKDNLIYPATLLRNYPEKSAQSDLFGLISNDLRIINIGGQSVEEQIEKLLGLYNAAIFRGDSEREFIVGTGPERDDLELRTRSPLRRI